MIASILVRNLLHKPLATTLSVLLLALSVGIISALLLVQTQAEQKFENDLKDIDLVVGAKGSPLQLVLSAVYQVDAPTGNVNLADVLALKSNPFVENIIPLAFGDSYKTFRIVGTDTAYLGKYGAILNRGRAFGSDMEAVLGSAVAKSTGLKVGDSIVSQHGADARGQAHDDHPYKIVGVLEPTGAVPDQLILTSVATVWHVHDEGQGKQGADNHKDSTSHSVSHPQPESVNQPKVMPTSPFMVVRKAGQPKVDADSAKETHAGEQITAALFKMRSPMGTLMLPRFISENTNLQAVVPSLEMNRLLNLMGIGIKTVQGIAIAIMIISGFSVFIALYNRLRQRQYEQALMRSLGCSRAQLLWLTLAEGWVLAVAGFLGGVILSRIGLFLLNRFAAASFHFQFSLAPIGAEATLLGLSLVIGTLAAVFPAVKAFHINISRTLAQG